MKKTLFIGLLAVAVLLAGTYALSPVFMHWPGWLADVGQRAQGIRTVLIGEHSVPLFVSESEQDRIRGLSGRATTSPAEGMLFLFPSDGHHGIWMKDMRFAIDIIWLSAEGIVVDIKENALPDSFPETYRPQELARYVIELPAGYAERLKVKLGSVIGL